MPGGIDPHTHLEMPFMGTYSTDDFESGTRAGLAGGTTMVVDFCLPSPNQSLLEALKMWDNKTSKASADYSFHMAITWWGEQVFNEMAEVVDRGITSFKHFMAYKGSLMVNDDEMFSSFSRCADLGALPLVHAENGDVVAAMTQKLLDAVTGRKSACPIFATARGRGRGPPTAPSAWRSPIWPACRSTWCMSPASRSHEAIRRARQPRACAVYRRAADPAFDARRERVFQPRLGLRGAPRDVAAVPQQAAPGFALGRVAVGLALGSGDRPLRLHHCAEAHRHRQFRQNPERYGRARRPLASALVRAASTLAG